MAYYPYRSIECYVEFAEARLEEGNDRVRTRGMQHRVQAEEVGMRKERADWMGQDGRLDEGGGQREEARTMPRSLA